MNCIVAPINNKGGIYLGSIWSAEDLKKLEENNIQAVLTVA
jgi:hypothetical protein